MSIAESIEVIVLNELQAICMNCQHFNTCTYRKHSTKTIIQCEMYEVAEEREASSSQLKGLCINCCNADACRLPQKEFGVWHCEEYE